MRIYLRNKEEGSGAGRSPSKRENRQSGYRKKNYILSPSGNLKEIGRYARIYLLCIVYWEILLHLQVQASIKGFSLWSVLFALPISLFAAVLNGWSSRHYRRNQIITAFIALIICFYYGAQLIYFESFGSLFSVSMVGMGTDAITNFWWSLSGTIVRNIPRLLLYLLPVFFLFACSLIPALDYFSKRLPHRGIRPIWHLAALAASAICWFLIVLLLPIGGKSDASAYNCYHSKFVDTDTASQKLGALPNTLVELKGYVFGSDSDTGLGDEENSLAALDGGNASEPIGTEDGTEAEEIETAGSDYYNVYDDLDFAELASKTSDSDIQTLCNYLDQLEPTNKNEYTGMFEGYNLIYICAESFSTYALNEKVTPTLCKLAGNGIVLNNYYNGFKNTTTNGEFAMLTGLWPDVSRDAKMGSAVGTMPQSATKNMFPCLGNMFSQIGVKARAYHNFRGSYYSRNESWPNMGFDCTFADTGLNITEGWPGSDLEMIEQSVDDYINDDRFCTYYMTFSGHGEYTEKNAMVQKNIDKVKELLGDEADDLTDADIDYLACNYELDQAIGCLTYRLWKTGKDKNTVIVLTGDHYPYYLFTADRNAFAGHTVDTNFEMYKSTCIIWTAGMSDTIQVDTPCCNVDILPTMLNLFNISYDSRLYAGVDIFSDAEHVAQLYNKNFVTDCVKYNASEEKAIWLEEDGTNGEQPATDEEKSAYIDSISDTVSKRYSVSLAIEDTDFYNFIAENISIPASDTAALPENALNTAAGTTGEAGAEGTEAGSAGETETTAAETGTAGEAETAAGTESSEAEIAAGEAGTANASAGTESSEAEAVGQKNGSGLIWKILRIILPVILAAVLLISLRRLYANRRYYRRKLRNYIREYKDKHPR